MHPALRRFPITFVMLEASAFTVTATIVECVFDAELPVTVSVNVEGVTEGPTLTFSADDGEPPLGGVTESGVKDADTPLGSADTHRFTGELNPLTELTFTDVEADPPTPRVIGETGLREKSELIPTAIFTTKALTGPRRVVWKAPQLVGKSAELVSPVT